MTIHFMSVVDGDKIRYKEIINIITGCGHKIKTNHYLNRTINEISSESFEESVAYTKNFKKWIKESDVVIFETTRSDINTGLELSFAISELKPVIILFDSNVSQFPYSLKGNKSELIQIIPYNNSNSLKKSLQLAIELSESQLSFRFNLILPSKQMALLSNIAKNRKISKSTVVRQMLEQLKNELS